MEARNRQQEGKADILCRWGARALWSLRVSLYVTVLTTLVVVASVPVAQGVCCVCEGAAPDRNFCLDPMELMNCSTDLSDTAGCAFQCGIATGHMKSCSSDTNCSGIAYGCDRKSTSLNSRHL